MNRKHSKYIFVSVIYNTNNMKPLHHLQTSIINEWNDFFDSKQNKKSTFLVNLDSI